MLVTSAGIDPLNMHDNNHSDSYSSDVCMVDAVKVPPSAEEVKTKANDLFKACKYSESILLYSQAIDLSPTTATYYSNRAAAYLMVNSFSESLADCIQAIHIEPDFTKAHFRAAKCQVHLGRLSEALEHIKNADKSGNASVKRKVADHAEAVNKEMREIRALETHIQACIDSLASGDFKKALTSVEIAMTLVDPSLRSTGAMTSVSNVDSGKMLKICIKWQMYRAQALVGCWDLDEAVTIAHSILFKNSRNSEALVLRARTMHLLDSHPATTIVQYLSQALTFDPDNKDARSLFKHIKAVEAIKQEGNDAFSKSNWADALSHYENYLVEDVNGGVIKAKVLSNRANVLSKLGKHTEASTDASKAITLLENICFPKVNFGVTPGAISNEDRAASILSALFYKLYLRRAEAFMKLEQYEDAVRDYECAATIKPKDQGVNQAVRNAKRLLALSKRKDYYKSLGCSRDASDSEIKKSYRKLALQFHPDKQIGLSDEERAIAETKFKEIAEAYTVLSDPQKKRRFDAGMDVDGASASDRHDHGGFGHHSASMDDLFSRFSHSGGFQSSQFGGSSFSFHTS
ncbi:hypothetical protein BASA50_008774 [Batrachochytrium salamandrivorans]|uniref:J domain-containing protein n=1 Tax=Batrachochytrium salamandrivorans TaxID=1357716 RepID=A0ABQ8F380_9FUNG|nr:hypothetical protein BASA62_007823 [Batrachochytrium salamandrivorans]KAH6578930.1 hypothetical protein BASA60_003467 [Batrachochytrium salamandrivorans]KAH6591330.1 hypothetical protein BASA50_008774 [Batrachochytrium salamandrivorans]KAH6602355.1 hypothetical protein BASA61_001183 [Batrachochytrium salamandrivorans]KAH9248605.1 hypothetical protein BASA81_013718 [Batrachochytrium salamandrivorans]